MKTIKQHRDTTIDTSMYVKDSIDVIISKLSILQNSNNAIYNELEKTINDRDALKTELENVKRANVDCMTQYTELRKDYDTLSNQTSENLKLIGHFNIAVNDTVGCIAYECEKHKLVSGTPLYVKTDPQIIEGKSYHVLIKVGASISRDFQFGKWPSLIKEVINLSPNMVFSGKKLANGWECTAFGFGIFGKGGGYGSGSIHVNDGGVDVIGEIK